MMKHTPSVKLGYLLVFGAGCLWGTTGAFLKFVYQFQVTSMQAAFMRGALALIMIGPFLALTRKGACKAELRDLPLLASVGMTLITTFSLAHFYTIQVSTITQAVFLLYTGPIFAVILSRIFLQELFLWSKIMALILSILGMILLTRIYEPSRISMPYQGILTGLGAALSYASYRVLGKVALRKYSPSTVLFYSLATGSFFLAFFTQPQKFILQIPAQAWLILLALSLVSGIVAPILGFEGLRRIEASRAAIVSSIEPVVAAILGFTLFGEMLAPSGFLGGALILLGAVLVQF